MSANDLPPPPPPPPDTPSPAVFAVVDAFEVMPGMYPGLTRAANGDLLATSHRSRARSTDNGRTWSPITWIGIPPRWGGSVGDSNAVGITTLKNGDILWPMNEEVVIQPYFERLSGLFVLRSSDHGHNWTQLEYVDVPGVRETWQYGKILELPDGTLILPIWGMRVLGERWRSALIKSRDGGKTWGDYRTIAWDPYAGGREDNGFNEATMVQMPSGELLAMVRQQQVWSYPDQRPKDYAEPHQELFRTFSRDGGDTWALPQRIALRATSPSLHYSPMGTLMLGYRDTFQANEAPDSKKRHMVSVRVSEDKGQSWVNELQLVDPRLDPNIEPQMGYPAFTNLPDGRILVVFYSNIPDGMPWRTQRIVGNILEERRK